MISAVFLCRSRLRPNLISRGLVGKAQKYSTGVSHDEQQSPLRVALVGSGPAGFYTAHRVMSRLQAKVDMYEALPVPFGLVRFGVAPDHPEVKNCQAKFEEVAASDDFTFIGNMSIGSSSGHAEGASIPLATLMRHYHAVVFAYGASRDRTLGIPGESLGGVYSAREFVGWYNGLPEHAGLAPDLTRGDEAVVVGQGNVALDVARMLLEDVDALRKTDMAEYALEALSRSRVRRVHVVGRRGPMQAAFTIKEVRELMKLPAVGLHSFDTSLVPPSLKELPRAPRRLMEVLLKGSAADPATAPRSWSLDFCLAPREFLPAADGSTSVVGKCVLERTALSSPFDAKSHARPTGELVDVPSSVVFRSIGYKAEALPGFVELDIPFDESRGIIRNDGLGRVVREVWTRGAAISQEPYPGLYCSGWVKRGPTGVIASTMEDAFATGDAIVRDWSTNTPFLSGHGGSADRSGWPAVQAEVGSLGDRVVTWADWRRIDQAELQNGARTGRTRRKFTSVVDMLAALR